MLSHPLKLVRLSGNLRSLALSAQADLPPSGLMQVVCPQYLHASRTRLFFFFPTQETLSWLLCCLQGRFSSCLCGGQITQSGTRLLCSGHTNTSLPLVFSSRIVCFHAWVGKREHPRGELALIHLLRNWGKSRGTLLKCMWFYGASEGKRGLRFKSFRFNDTCLAAWSLW